MDFKDVYLGQCVRVVNTEEGLRGNSTFEAASVGEIGVVVSTGYDHALFSVYVLLRNGRIDHGNHSELVAVECNANPAELHKAAYEAWLGISRVNQLIEEEGL